MRIDKITEGNNKEIINTNNVQHKEQFKQPNK